MQGTPRINDSKCRAIDQPVGWLGGTIEPDSPILTNLWLDPVERGNAPSTSQSYYKWIDYQFWRFVFGQECLAESSCRLA
ncbi:MAG TPA: hypothetical protein VMS18_12530 [Candidatus Binatia bacterium]|nr:hypothetical protein [Candidatus Binatia bacterium]